MIEKLPGFFQVPLLPFRIKRVIGKPAAEQDLSVIFYGFWHQDVPFLEHNGRQFSEFPVFIVKDPGCQRDSPPANPL